MKSDAAGLTVLLHRINDGDKSAEAELYEIVAPELRAFAAYLLRGERANHTLQATELVNRAYLRLANKQLSLRDRAHFFAIVARAMRRELIDYGRSRKPVSSVPLDDVSEAGLLAPQSFETILVVDQLLDQMRGTMPVECSIVEFKAFLGLSDAETASMLNLPLRTMQLKWHDARVWLFERAIAQGWKLSHD